MGLSACSESERVDKGEAFKHFFAVMVGPHISRCCGRCHTFCVVFKLFRLQMFLFERIAQLGLIRECADDMACASSLQDQGEFFLEGCQNGVLELLDGEGMKRIGTLKPAD
jgi:hypothetical protein